MTLSTQPSLRVAFIFMNNKYLQVGRGAGFIVAAILEAGFSLQCYDSYQKSADFIMRDIVRQDFDVLMVSTMSPFFPEAVDLINAVKSQKDIPVLMGGIHPTSVGGSLLEQHSAIDFLCIGEGEAMVVEFLNKLGTDDLYDIPNLAYRSNGQVIVNAMRPPEDLASLPAFPWHQFPMEAKANRAYIMASRGCPYRCSYCANSMYLKKYGKSYLRYRPIAHVLDEMAGWIREYGPPEYFYFLDEMMLANLDFVTELFTAVKNKFDMPYALQGRAEHVTDSLIGLLQDTGCIRFTMGVECGNEDFRKKYLNRYMTNEQIRSAFSRLSHAGIATVSNNIIGFPFDHDNELTKETINLNLELHPDYANFAIFYPYPGTQLHQYCVDNDLIDPIKLQEYTRNEDSILRDVKLKEKLHNIVRFLNYPRHSEATERTVNNTR